MTDQAGHLPAAPNVKIDSPIAQSFADAAAAGLARPQRAEFNNYWGPFGDALNKVIDKGTDPTQAVADACKAMNEANKQVAFARGPIGGALAAPRIVPGPCSATVRSPARGRYAAQTRISERPSQEEEHPGMATTAAVATSPRRNRNWRRKASPYLYLRAGAAR